MVSSLGPSTATPRIQKNCRGDVRSGSGAIHSVIVTTDAHLSLTVLLNGSPLVQQSCMINVSRHQLQFPVP